MGSANTGILSATNDAALSRLTPVNQLPCSIPVHARALKLYFGGYIIY